MTFSKGAIMAGIELYAPRTERHRRTWTWAAIVLGFVFITFGQVLSLFPVFMAAKLAHIPIDPANLGPSIQAAMTKWPVVAAMLFGFAFTALPVFLWVWLFERRGLRAIGFNRDGLKRFGRGFLIGLGFLAAVVGLIWAVGGYRIEAAGVWGAPSVAACLPIVILLVGFCIQGSTEEIVMRGWIMQLIASRHGLVWAMVLNAILFSLLHGMNIKPAPELALGLINIVLVGVFFSLYAVREQSIWGVCGWHAAWNWLLGLGFGLEVSGNPIETPPLIVDLTGSAGAPWWITGGKFGPEGSLATTFILALGIVWLAWKMRTRQPQGFAVEAAN
jgi:membrane protease YdiL (CAAX protease family)